MRKLGRWFAGLAVVLLVVCGVGGLLVFRMVERNVAHPPVLEPRSEAAIDFAFRTLDGGEKHLTDFKGKVIFLDLWGTWCVQCVAEMPWVESLYTRFKGDPNVQFLIVSRLDSPQTVRRFATLRKLDLPFFVMHDEDIPPAMYLQQYPATFVYSRDGMMVAQHAGGADWSDRSVVTLIQKLEGL